MNISIFQPMLSTVRAVVVLVTLTFGIPSAYSQSIDVESDWQQRIAGAFYSENFDYPDKSSLISAAAQVNGNVTENMSLETVHTLSGKGVRIGVPADGGSNTGSWNNFINGQDDQNYKRFYLQYILYADEHWLNYPFKMNSGAPASPKTIIIDKWNSSYNPGEVVVTNQYMRGFVTSYRGSNSGYPPFQKTISGNDTPCPNGDPDYLWQFPLDTGSPAVVQSCADFKQRYGPLQYNFSGDIAPGILLNVQGTPDADASVAGVTWVRNGFTVVEVFIDHDNDLVKIWASEYGKQPVLVMDSTELNGGADLGGNGYNGFQLTPYRTDGARNELNRRDTFISYAEVIVSTSPVPFPGGYDLPSGPSSAGLPEPSDPPPSSTDQAPNYIADLADFEARRLDNEYAPANNNISMRDVTPNEWISNDPGMSGIQGVITAWNGGAKGEGTKLFVHGGGHSDSANNGIYIYDFGGTTVPGGWRQDLNISSLSAVVENQATYSDNRPTAVHTYDGMVYADHNNHVYRFGGSQYRNGFMTRNAFKYDVVSNKWSQIPQYPGSSGGAKTIYDRQTGKIFVTMNDSLSGYFYRTGNDSWSSSIGYSGNGFEFNATGAWDSSRNRGIIVGAGERNVLDIDFASESVVVSDFSVSGDTSILDKSGISVVYDRFADVFWMFGGGSGSPGWNRIYRMNADGPPWVIQSFPISGDSIETTNGMIGSWGRFVFMPKWRALGFVASERSPAYVIGLPSADVVSPLSPSEMRAQ